MRLLSHGFNSVGEEAAVCCRVVQLGLFRLLTNTAVMGIDVQTRSDAWLIWGRLIQDVRVVFSPEAEQLEKFLQRFSSGKQSGQRQWTDAYLTAFAENSGLQVVTFDHGFKTYRGLTFTCLSHCNAQADDLRPHLWFGGDFCYCPPDELDERVERCFGQALDIAVSAVFQPVF
jgi:predicted nucleic acid-binding protein